MKKTFKSIFGRLKTPHDNNINNQVITRYWPEDRREISIDFLYSTSAGSLSSALTEIYQSLYLGEWSKNVPPVTEFKEDKLLYGVNYTYIKLHKNHKKFGTNIVEYGDNTLKNHYCFFDYSRLEALFEWYEKHIELCKEHNIYDTSDAPPIPTYHALPSDRLSYGTAAQEWGN